MPLVLSYRPPSWHQTPQQNVSGLTCIHECLSSTWQLPSQRPPRLPSCLKGVERSPGAQVCEAAIPVNECDPVYVLLLESAAEVHFDLVHRFVLTIEPESF